MMILLQTCSFLWCFAAAALVVAMQGTRSSALLFTYPTKTSSRLVVAREWASLLHDDHDKRQLQSQLYQTNKNIIVLHSSNKNNNDSNRLDKGFNLLEIASSVVPQGRIVSTVKESWKFGWKRMMAELAPQDSKGRYTRPSYSFQGRIGATGFPDEPGRYHLYVGNPCPVSRNLIHITSVCWCLMWCDV